MDSCSLAGDQGGLCLRVPGTLPRPPLMCPSPCAAHPLRLPRPFSRAVPATLQEVVLWRKGDIVRKSMSHQAAIASQRFEGTTPLGEARTPGPLSDGGSRQ